VTELNQATPARSVRLTTAALLLLPIGLTWGHGAAQVDTSAPAREIVFPDVPGASTLVVDLHSHSVFSDGHVWPKIRIEEALRDGLDAFAVTEHLEYQPHLADIPHPDRNRSFEEASAAAADTSLIVIAGSEITRNLPAGHINAVFISDANLLFRVANPPADPAATRDYYNEAGTWPPEEAVAAANAQGAFVFMNHPDWTSQRPSGIAELSELQQRLIDAGQLHGIEIANGDAFSMEALDIALANNLTLLGVSDVHDLIDWDYPPATGAHRPVTLVFSRDRSAAGIRQALFDHRTVVWFKNLLVGREVMLLPLLQASLQVTSASYAPETDVVNVTFSNSSDAALELRNRSDYSMQQHAESFTVPPHGTTTVTLKPGQRLASLQFFFEVSNALTAPGRHPVLEFNVTPN